MYIRPLRLALLAALGCLLAVTPAVAEAQILDGLRRRAASLAAEAQLLSEPTTALDESRFTALQVGPLTFGVSDVQIKDGVAVRLTTYLYNPGAEAVAVERPNAERFQLIDARGRKLDLIGGPSAKGEAAESDSIRVPAIERVSLTLLFSVPPAAAATATLKVGPSAMIAGIPVHSSAVAAVAAAGPGSAATPSAPQGSASVWDAPPTPPLPAGR